MRLKKDGTVDRRFRDLEEIERSFWQQYGALIGTTILGFMAGGILATTLWNAFHPAIISPKGLGVARVPQVMAKEPERYCGDPISYIRCSGEALGRDNKTIRTMIEIARKESNFKPRAKNPKSTASGVFQITAGTWYSNDCVGDKWNFKDNTDCAWKIQEKGGFQPWEVWNKGFVKL